MRVTVHDVPLDPPEAVTWVVCGGEADIYAGPRASQVQVDYAVTAAELGILPVRGPAELPLPVPRLSAEAVSSRAHGLTTPA